MGKNDLAVAGYEGEGIGRFDAGKADRLAHPLGKPRADVAHRTDRAVDAPLVGVVMLAGTGATLGIIPIGTQNNTALSLGIPSDIPSAIAILRSGRRIKVDVGMAACGSVTIPFLEVCSVGLVSTLFPSADDIQHGNLARVGDFLATLVGSPSAEIRLLLDGRQEIQGQGHIVLVSNMPYIGLHYQVGSTASFSDGLLDVLFFAELSKLDLLGYVLQGVREGKPEDPRIQHYHVRRVEIDTLPAMAVMVDGSALGTGLVRIEVQRHALAVMVARQAVAGQAVARPAVVNEAGATNLGPEGTGA